MAQPTEHSHWCQASVLPAGGTAPPRGESGRATGGVGVRPEAAEVPAEAVHQYAGEDYAAVGVLPTGRVDYLRSAEGCRQLPWPDCLGQL